MFQGMMFQGMMFQGLHDVLNLSLTQHLNLEGNDWFMGTFLKEQLSMS